MTASPSLLDDALRAAGEPGFDVVDHVGVVDLVALLADIPEVRREHDIVELAQRMIDGQRLDVERVEAGARDSALAERREQGGLVDDRC